MISFSALDTLRSEHGTWAWRERRTSYQKNNRIPVKGGYFRQFPIRIRGRTITNPFLLFVNSKNRISTKNRIRLLSFIDNRRSCHKRSYRCNFLRRVRICAQKKHSSWQSWVTWKNLLWNLLPVGSFLLRWKEGCDQTNFRNGFYA